MTRCGDAQLVTVVCHVANCTAALAEEVASCHVSMLIHNVVFLYHVSGLSQLFGRTTLTTWERFCHFLLWMYRSAT